MVVSITRRTGLTALAGFCTALTGGLSPASAEVGEVRISKQYGLPYMAFMVMERMKLIEKHAKEQGLGGQKVSWVTLATPAAMMDAVLSGQMDFIAPGVPTLATMWDKTVGTPQEIRALSALQSMPYVLVTRDKNVKTIRDYTDKHRIALPTVKLTGHAIALQMAVAKEWGRDQFDRLDKITVSRPHPDAATALLSGNSEITSHFASSPFYYFELADPAIHKVLHSYDAVGGRHTNGVLMVTKRYFEANPKTCAAVLAAVNEANAFIKANPLKAAEIYVEVNREKRSTVEEIAKMVADPDVEYTTTPINIMKFVEFMHLAGTIKKKPESWKDLFFPTAYNLSGS